MHYGVNLDIFGLLCSIIALVKGKPINFYISLFYFILKYTNAKYNSFIEAPNRYITLIFDKILFRNFIFIK